MVVGWKICDRKIGRDAPAVSTVTLRCIGATMGERCEAHFNATVFRHDKSILGGGVAEDKRHNAIVHYFPLPTDQKQKTNFSRESENAKVWPVAREKKKEKPSPPELGCWKSV